MRQKTKFLTAAAVFAAVISIFSAISLPLGTVPVSLSIFGVILTAVAVGAKISTASVGIFLLLGVTGLPVFGGLQGGAGVLLGPTGGYILSYILMAFIVGRVSDMKIKSKKTKLLLLLASGLAALAVCYLWGVGHFMAVTGQSLEASLAMCVYPFILPDLIKTVGAVLLGVSLKKRMGGAG